MRSTLIMALACGVALRCGEAPVHAAPPAEPCAGRARAVIVSTRARELRLCERGKTSRTFAVALGTGGDDKRVRGDARTPLGTYPLGAPRASASFGTFIPLGYPTAQQRRQGFTGSDVGLHGPGRDSRFLGAVNTSVDWTLGCIAVASDREIEEVAAFVRGAPMEVTIVREFQAAAATGSASRVGVSEALRLSRTGTPRSAGPESSRRRPPTPGPPPPLPPRP